MRWLLFFVLLLMCFSGFAQKKDTIYYNKYWNKSKKKNAEYYRPVPLKKENNLFVILDYYKDGTLQFKGYSAEETKDVFDGEAVWYYENGQVMLKQNFKNGNILGAEESYFRDGAVLSSGVYLDGKK